MSAQRTQTSQTDPRDRLAALKLGDPMSRVRRTQDHSISLSPAEREGHYARNPGELAIGNDLELKEEFDRIRKSFVELPDELGYMPKINPCGKESPNHPSPYLSSMQYISLDKTILSKN